MNIRTASQLDGLNPIIPPPDRLASGRVTTDKLKQAALEPAQAADLPASAEQVTQAADDLQQLLIPKMRELRFRVETKSGALVVSVIDVASQTVLLQIGPREMVAMARSVHAAPQLGLLVDDLI